jgi:integrase/recombinase XerD
MSSAARKKKAVTVGLYLRIRNDDGSWSFAAASRNSKGRLRPLHAIVNGRSVEHREGVYHLRYRLGSKRVWEKIGTDPSVVDDAVRRQELELAAEDLGAKIAPSPDLTPVASAPPLPSPQQELPPPNCHELSDCIREFLDETEAHKAPRTYAAYSKTLTLFKEAVEREYVEDITRADMLAFIAFLKKRGNSPRTVRNRVDYLLAFVNHWGLPLPLKWTERPTYTEKAPRRYKDSHIAQMFAAATVDEADLLSFLLYTGAREQEAQYACWTDLDLEARTYTITEHLDLGYRPKDSEEGTVPIPDVLVDRLIARRGRYPKTRLIFPAKEGGPNGHSLRIIKRLALRAGVNCGHCVNKKGQSCATHPVCRHIILHKCRKTFASELHKNAFSARTIMRYLRHSELEVTMRYLADEDDDQMRGNLNRAFSGFAVGGAA